MSTAPIGGGAGGDDPAAVAAREAARGLEAYFVRQMLAQVKMPGLGAESGFAEDTFGDMLRDALSDSMASSDQLGLQASLRPALDPESGSVAEPADVDAPQRVVGPGAIADAIDTPFFLDPPLKAEPERPSRRKED